MKLKPYDFAELGNINGGYKPTRNFKLLDEFVKGGHVCAKIEDWPQKNATTCKNSLDISIKHFKLSNIMVVVRKGEVFLINKSLCEQKRFNQKD